MKKRTVKHCNRLQPKNEKNTKEDFFQKNSIKMK